MIKPATLKDELFVVLIPGGKVLELASDVQEILSRRYNIYEEGFYPQIHITLDRIKRGSSNKAGQLIKAITGKWHHQVKIVVQDFNCIHFAENKYLMLDVMANESLKYFAEKIHDKLTAAGLTVINDYSEWDFHITIINNLFSHHKLTEAEFDEICSKFNGKETPCISLAESIEIWRPTLNPSKKSLSKIKLNKY